MKKRITVALLIFIFALCSVPYALSHEGDQHYREIEAVLFGPSKFRIVGNDEKKKLLQHLEYVTAIAIDQNNGSHSGMFKDLQLYGVPNLPPNMTDPSNGNDNNINFRCSRGIHRKYTHLGWTFTYRIEYDKNKEPITSNWPVRKKMMVETVRKVLGSDKYKEEIYDSFAAILYYVHLLGDMQTDSTRTERDQVIPLIDKHGLGDIISYKANRDVFTELHHYLPILFQGNVNKTYQSYYDRMIRQIKQLYYKVKTTMKDNIKNGTATEDNYLTSEQLDRYSRELLKILSDNMPTLLEHSYFSGVFYQ